MNKLRQLEQDVLAEGREWTRRRLEKRLQEDSDAMPAVCPKTGEGLKDVRWRDLQLMSISGGGQPEGSSWLQSGSGAVGLSGSPGVGSSLLPAAQNGDALGLSGQRRVYSSARAELGAGRWTDCLASPGDAATRTGV